MSRADEHEEVITTSRAAQYTLWNLVGLLLPVAVAVVAFPLLLNGLGKERFGILTLIWMLAGYFGILDLGLGRALTKMTSERLGSNRSDEVAGLFWTTFSLMAVIGLVGSCLVAVGAPILVHDLLKIDPEFQRETLHSFYMVCLGLPAILLSVALIGALEAHHRFKRVNLIRIPVGSAIFLAPLCVLPFSNQLFPVVTALIAVRILECVLYLIAWIQVRPDVWKDRQLDRRLIYPLLTFGGWMTISNLILPLMIHIDRYLIGIWVSVAVVAYYSVPSEMVVKLLVFPKSWVSVLFPSFAAHYHRDASAVTDLFVHGVRYLLFGMFPLVLGIVAFSPEGLLLWLGPDMAENSTRILQLLTGGMFLYSLVYVPYLFLQSIGRPDISARIHLLEFPVYLGAAYGLIQSFGILGAAGAWIVRVVLDILLMYAAASRHLQNGLTRLQPLVLVLLLMLGALAGMAVLPSLWVRIGLLVVGLPMYAGIVWMRIIKPEDREEVLAALRRLGVKKASS